jgi:hypothetical protein
MMSIFLLLLGLSGSSTTKVIYVQGVFSGQAYAYGLYCCRFHGFNQSSVIRFTIAWGSILHGFDPLTVVFRLSSAGFVGIPS